MNCSISKWKIISPKTIRYRWEIKLKTARFVLKLVLQRKKTSISKTQDGRMHNKKLLLSKEWNEQNCNTNYYSLCVKLNKNTSLLTLLLNYFTFLPVNNIDTGTLQVETTKCYLCYHVSQQSFIFFEMIIFITSKCTWAL